MPTILLGNSKVIDTVRDVIYLEADVVAITATTSVVTPLKPSSKLLFHVTKPDVGPNTKLSC